MIITNDFYLAAYFLYKGYKLEEHSRKNNQSAFGFFENESINEDKEQYYTLKATVEPMSYGSAMRTLKSVLHSYSNKNSNLNSNSGGTINVKQPKGNK